MKNICVYIFLYFLLNTFSLNSQCEKQYKYTDGFITITVPCDVKNFVENYLIQIYGRNIIERINSQVYHLSFIDSYVYRDTKVSIFIFGLGDTHTPYFILTKINNDFQVINNDTSLIKNLIRLRDFLSEINCTNSETIKLLYNEIINNYIYDEIDKVKKH